MLLTIVQGIVLAVFSLAGTLFFTSLMCDVVVVKRKGKGMSTNNSMTKDMVLMTDVGMLKGVGKETFNYIAEMTITATKLPKAYGVMWIVSRTVGRSSFATIKVDTWVVDKNTYWLFKLLPFSFFFVARGAATAEYISVLGGGFVLIK